MDRRNSEHKPGFVGTGPAVRPLMLAQAPPLIVDQGAG
jgi:hypothetical protein